MFRQPKDSGKQTESAGRAMLPKDRMVLPKSRTIRLEPESLRRQMRRAVVCTHAPARRAFRPSVMTSSAMPRDFGKNLGLFGSLALPEGLNSFLAVLNCGRFHS
jgi:hypothetical protein